MTSRFRWWKPLVLVGLALAAGACAQRRPVSGRLSPPPPKPRFTASASTLAATNEWRPVISPVRAPDAMRATNAPSIIPPPAAIPAFNPAPVVVPPPAPKPAAPTPTPTAPAPVGRTPAPADGGGAYHLRPGDPIIVHLRGIYPREEEFENYVDEQGFIKLPHLDRVKAAGLTCSQLEDEIERQYIDGKIYRSITVNVLITSQSYYIQGEVKNPGRVPLATTVTLLQAIAQAGGPTDYADEGDVRIIRAGKTNPYNAKDLKRHPERDVRIEPGDVINVGRKFF